MSDANRSPTGSGPPSRQARLSRVLLRTVIPAVVIFLAWHVGVLTALRSGCESAYRAIEAVQISAYPDEIAARMDHCDYHLLVLCKPRPARPFELSPVDRCYAGAIDGTVKDPEDCVQWAGLVQIWDRVKAVAHLPDAVIYTIALQYERGGAPFVFFWVFLFFSVVVPLVLLRGNVIAVFVGWPLVSLVILGLTIVVQFALGTLAELSAFVLGMAIYLLSFVTLVGRDAADAVAELIKREDKSGEIIDNVRDSIEWSHSAHEVAEASHQARDAADQAKGVLIQTP